MNYLRKWRENRSRRLTRKELRTESTEILLAIYNRLLNALIMNYTLDKKDQYSLVDLKEPFLGNEVPAALEEVARTALKGSHNLILNLNECTDLDTTGAMILRKINRLCANGLGIFIVVTGNDDMIDKLENAKIQDLEIFYTVEEAIDAVFMHDLENEFGAGEDGYDLEDNDNAED